jgi:hypothetical protein
MPTYFDKRKSNKVVAVGTQDIAVRKAFLLQRSFEVFAFGVSGSGLPLTTGPISSVDYGAGQICSARGNWSVLEWAEPEFDWTKYGLIGFDDAWRIFRYGADKWQRERDPFRLPRAGYLYLEPWKLIASGVDLYVTGLARPAEQSSKPSLLIDRVSYFNLAHKLAVSTKDGCHYRLMPYEEEVSLNECYLRIFSFSHPMAVSPYVLGRHELEAV